MENAQITVTVYGGFDGGLVIYESSPGGEESRLVFGGNLEEANKYLHKRMSELLDEKAQAEKLPRITPRVTARALADRLVEVE